MIFSCNKLGLEIHNPLFQPLVIVVEKEESLVQLISDIQFTIEGRQESIMITESEKQISLSKEANIIIDPWSIDCNSKVIKNHLYRLLFQLAQEISEEEYLELKTNMFCYIEKISDHISYDIKYNTDVDQMMIFKGLDITVNVQDEDITERLVEYMKLLQSLCKIKVLFLVNIKSFFSSEQILLLYKEARYINLQLILIESVQKTRLSDENMVIIDKDNCIINLTCSVP